MHKAYVYSLMNLDKYIKQEYQHLNQDAGHCYQHRRFLHEPARTFASQATSEVGTVRIFTSLC